MIFHLTKELYGSTLGNKSLILKPHHYTYEKPDLTFLSEVFCVDLVLTIIVDINEIVSSL